MKKRSRVIGTEEPHILSSFISPKPRLEIYNNRLNAQKSQNPFSVTNGKGKNIYTKMQKDYKGLQEPDQQLARFLFHATTDKLDGIHDNNKYGTLDKLYLLNTPYINPETEEREDLYDSKFQKLIKQKKEWIPSGEEEQAITLSPNQNSTNPIMALAHEVTHALDDNYMRIPQNEIINYLTDLENQKTITIPNINTKSAKIDGNNQLVHLIKDTQKILPGATGFARNYPPEFFINNIVDSLQNLGDKDTDDGTLAKAGLVNQKGKKYQIDNLDKAKKALKLLREGGTDPGLAFWNFSEFPAFATETLNTPWLVSSKTNRLAKGFMLKVLEGLNRGFKDLGLNQNNYPSVWNSLNNRRSELEYEPVSQAIPYHTSSPISQVIQSKKRKREEDNDDSNSSFDNDIRSPASKKVRKQAATTTLPFPPLNLRRSPRFENTDI